ncbi:MAG: Mur ligase family protein [Clostridia bacterium]|nr:Mur ligase family protein [Clostridia bacterium]
MLIAGIAGQNGINETAGLVNSILSSKGKKVSVIDSRKLKELDSKRLKSYLFELLKSNVDTLVLKINLIDMEDEIFDNINFDVIIYTDKADELKESFRQDYSRLMRKMLSLLREKGTAIVNADDNELIDILKGTNHSILTYGFNSQASITTSSIGDNIIEDKIMCSLQKTISAMNGMTIEPQEYVVKVQNRDADSYNVLAAASFAIVNGVWEGDSPSEQRF